MTHRSVRRILTQACLTLLLVAPGALVAQTINPNCTIIVPDAPLTAKGLSTPYQLVATDAAAGPCNESNPDQSAFVQAGVIDPATGKISVYNPLVITQGTSPAAAPVVPTLPQNAIVALWFGYNGDTLTLQANQGVLQTNNCVNGDGPSHFGQFAYCNAPAFFQAANTAINNKQLAVPALGVAKDGKPCPTSRDFFIVDQDQSDNLPEAFLSTQVGLAQNTTANLAQFPGAVVVRNPSDEGLIAKFVDPILGCASWKAPDLADPGKIIPALALNELQAAALQQHPRALVPAGDPMVLVNGAADLDKLNAYRIGVDQPTVDSIRGAETERYCRHLVTIAPPRLAANQAALVAAASPVPADGSNLFTFLAQRFVGSFDILGCGALLHVPDPVAVTRDANGVATSATINASTPPAPSGGGRHRRGGHPQW